MRMFLTKSVVGLLVYVSLIAIFGLLSFYCPIFILVIIMALAI